MGGFQDDCNNRREPTPGPNRLQRRYVSREADCMVCKHAQNFKDFDGFRNVFFHCSKKKERRRYAIGLDKDNYCEHFHLQSDKFIYRPISIHPTLNVFMTRHDKLDDPIDPQRPKKKTRKQKRKEKIEAVKKRIIFRMNGLSKDSLEPFLQTNVEQIIYNYKKDIATAIASANNTIKMQRIIDNNLDFQQELKPLPMTLYQCKELSTIQSFKPQNYRKAEHLCTNFHQTVAEKRGDKYFSESQKAYKRRNYCMLIHDYHPLSSLTEPQQQNIYMRYINDQISINQLAVMFSVDSRIITRILIQKLMNGTFKCKNLTKTILNQIREMILKRFIQTQYVQNLIEKYSLDDSTFYQFLQQFLALYTKQTNWKNCNNFLNQVEYYLPLPNNKTKTIELHSINGDPCTLTLKEKENLCHQSGAIPELFNVNQPTTLPINSNPLLALQHHLQPNIQDLYVLQGLLCQGLIEGYYYKDIIGIFTKFQIEELYTKFKQTILDKIEDTEEYTTSIDELNIKFSIKWNELKEQNSPKKYIFKNKKLEKKAKKKQEEKIFFKILLLQLEDITTQFSLCKNQESQLIPNNIQNLDYLEAFQLFLELQYLIYQFAGYYSKGNTQEKKIKKIIYQLINNQSKILSKTWNLTQKWENFPIFSQLVFFFRKMGFYLNSDLYSFMPKIATKKEYQQYTTDYPSSYHNPIRDMIIGGKSQVRPMVPNEFTFDKELFCVKGTSDVIPFKDILDADLMDKNIPLSLNRITRKGLKMKYIEQMYVKRILGKCMSHTINNFAQFGKYINQERTSEYFQLTHNQGKNNSLKRTGKPFRTAFEGNLNSAISNTEDRTRKIEKFLDMIPTSIVDCANYCFTGYLSGFLLNEIKPSNLKITKNDPFASATRTWIRTNFSSGIHNAIQNAGEKYSWFRKIKSTNFIQQQFNSKRNRRFHGYLAQILKILLKSKFTAKSSELISYTHTIRYLEKYHLLWYLFQSFTIPKYLIPKKYYAFAEKIRESKIFQDDLATSFELVSLKLPKGQNNGTKPKIIERSIQECLEIFNIYNYFNEVKQHPEDESKKESQDEKKPEIELDVVINYTNLLKLIIVSCSKILHKFNLEMKKGRNVSQMDYLKSQIKIYQNLIARYILLIQTIEDPSYKKCLAFIFANPIFPSRNYLERINIEWKHWVMAKCKSYKKSSQFYLLAQSFMKGKNYSLIRNICESISLFVTNFVSTKSFSHKFLHDEKESGIEKIYNNIVQKVTIEYSNLKQKKEIQWTFPAVSSFNLVIPNQLIQFFSDLKANIQKQVYKTDAPLSISLSEPNKLFLRDNNSVLSHKIRYFGQKKIFIYLDYKTLSERKKEEIDKKLKQDRWKDKIKSLQEEGKSPFKSEIDYSLPKLISRYQGPMQLKVNSWIKKLETEIDEQIFPWKKCDLVSPLPLASVKYKMQEYNELKEKLSKIVSKNNKKERFQLQHQLQELRRERYLKFRELQKIYTYIISALSPKKEKKQEHNVKPYYHNPFLEWDGQSLVEKESVIDRVNVQDCVQNSTQKKYVELRKILEGEAPRILEIPLSDNLIRKIQQGAEIVSISFIPSKNPAHKITANISLSIPENDYAKCNQFPDISTDGQDHPSRHLGIDLNRLSSLRGISYGILEEMKQGKASNPIPKKINMEFEEKELNMLVKTLPWMLNLEDRHKIFVNYSKLCHALTPRGKGRYSFAALVQAKISSIETYRNKKFDQKIAQLIIQEKKIDTKIEKKINKEKLKQLNIDKTKISQQIQAYKNPKFRKSTFNDIIGTPIFIWGTKMDHLRNHAAMVQTKISKYIAKSPTSSKLKRLQGEYTLLNRRRQTIRNQIQEYITRTLYYMINRFNIDMVKMENLSSLSPRGKKGYFARIIADMIKQLGTEIERGSIIWRLNQWCEKEHPNLQYIKRNPRNTSKIHFWCEGDGRVIRGDDWEFGTCSKCDEINIDTHLNACYNIANWGMRPPPKDLVSPS